MSLTRCNSPHCDRCNPRSDQDEDNIDALRARLEAADKSDRHNEAVINELKRQLTEAVRERNTIHVKRFREGVEAIWNPIMELLERSFDAARDEDFVRLDNYPYFQPDGTGASNLHKNDLSFWNAELRQIRALLDQPGDQAKE